MLELRGVSFRHGDHVTLADIDFSIQAGEKVVLLGANGSGKSTLLKLINGLLPVSEGEIRYHGEAITPEHLKGTALGRRFRREVALLFQNPDTMLFNPTVYDEIAFGPRQHGLADVESRVLHWAEAVGVQHHLARAPFGLSGGEKQKVCLAALMALEPKLLLLDEPTTALDPRSTGWLVDFLADLPVTVLSTTHNLSLAAELGSRALVLAEHHQLIYDGPIGPFLGDMDRLLAANLVHSHRHKHGDHEHRHYHIHNWD